jgi:hypothetical protein
MATLGKTTFGTSTTIGAITLASLAASTAGVGREGTVIDNTTNLYIDAMLYLAVKLGSGTVGMDSCVYVYVYGSEDGTTFCESTVTGSDAAITFGTSNNLKLAGVMVFGTSATGTGTQKLLIGSIASCFGGNLPRKWGVVIQNATNIAFSATEGDMVHTYTGIYGNAV